MGDVLTTPPISEALGALFRTVMREPRHQSHYNVVLGNFSLTQGRAGRQKNRDETKESGAWKILIVNFWCIL